MKAMEIYNELVLPGVSEEEGARIVAKCDEIVEKCREGLKEKKYLAYAGVASQMKEFKEKYDKNVFKKLIHEEFNMETNEVVIGEKKIPCIIYDKRVNLSEIVDSDEIVKEESVKESVKETSTPGVPHYMNKDVKLKKDWNNTAKKNYRDFEKKNAEDKPKFFDTRISEELYNNGNYSEFLKKACFTNTSFKRYRDDYLLKIVDACKKLLGDESEENLTEFEIAVIKAESYSDFRDIRRNPEMLKMGRRNSLDKVNFNNAYMNLATDSRFYVNNLRNVIKRLRACNSKFYVYFILFGLCVSQQKAQTELMKEYVKFAIEKKQFSFFNLIVSMFKDICVAIAPVLYGGAIDSGNLNLVKTIHELLGVKEYDEIVGISNTPFYNAEAVATVLKSSINREVAQKFLNIYLYKIYKEYDEKDFKEYFADVLAEIIYIDDDSDFDEVMSNKTITEFRWDVKFALIKSEFESILERMFENPKLYNLACRMLEDLIEEDIDSKALYEKGEQLCSSLIENADENWSNVLEIYNCFKFDEGLKSRIEEAYGNYLDKIVTDENFDEALEDLRANKRNIGIIYLYRKYNQLFKGSKEKLIYIDALLAEKKYKEYVKIVVEAKDITNNEKVKWLRSVMLLNFRINGISDEAYEIFNDDFTLQDAEQMILSENPFSVKQSPVILMGLYAGMNEWAKAEYLYAINFKNCGAGNKKFFSQLRKKDSLLTSLSSHYTVIEKSVFTKLSADEIVEFFVWCENLPKYTINNYEPKSGNKDVFDYIVTGADQESVWKSLVENICGTTKKRYVGTWAYSMIAAYIAMFHEQFDSASDYFTHLITTGIEKISGELPKNFIKLNMELLEIATDDYLIRLTSFLGDEKAMVNNGEAFSADECQAFYEKLLELYKKTDRITYLNLATVFYAMFKGCSVPHFDEYIEIVKDINSDKDVVLRLLFNLLEDGRNEREITEFISFEGWKCDKRDKVARELILSFCTDYSYVEALGIKSKRLKLTFKSDCCKLLEKYPFTENYERLLQSKETMSYRLILLKVLQSICFNKDLYWDFTDDFETVLRAIKNENTDELFFSGEEAYLNMTKDSYYIESATCDDMGYEYVLRKYLYMLLVDTYNGDGSSLPDDLYILERMEENGHRTIMEESYGNFKKLLKAVLDSSITVKDKKEIIMFFITSSVERLWEKGVINSCVEFEKSHAGVLKLLVKYLSYPNVAQGILKSYLDNRANDEFVEGLRSIAQITTDYTREVISFYEGAEDDEKLDALMLRLASENNRPKLLRAVAYGEAAETAAKYLDLISHVLAAISYRHNIIRDFGVMIRSKKASTANSFIKKLLSILNADKVFDYLRAIEYAMAEDVEGAKIALGSIVTEDLPANWGDEYLELKEFVEGKSKQFECIRVYNEFIKDASEDAIEKETYIESVTVIRSVLGNVSDVESVGEAKKPYDEFKALMRKRTKPERRVQAWTRLLAVINPEEYEALRDKLDLDIDLKKEDKNSFNEKVTYNEFVFDNTLVLLTEAGLDRDAKLMLLMELYDNVDNLSDAHKGEMLNRLNVVFRSVVMASSDADGSISYKKWLEYHERINRIIKTFGEGEFDNWDEQLIECEKCLEAKDATNEERIAFFEKRAFGEELRGVRKHFLMSQQKEYNRLLGGVRAKMKICKAENEYIIDNGEIFIILENSKDSKKTFKLSELTFKLECDGKEYTNKYVAEKLKGSELDLLRPTYLTGLNIKVPKAVMEVINAGEKPIKISMLYNGVKICSAEELFDIKHADTTIKANGEYNVKQSAWTNAVAGFGREEIQKQIRVAMRGTLPVMLYGPSRTGKTSLLFWIENILLNEKKSNVERISRYMGNLSEMNINSILKHMFAEPLGKIANRIKCSDIKRCVAVDSDVDKYYKKLETASENLNEDVYILIDEFQEIFSYLASHEDARIIFEGIITKIRDEEIKHIHLVMCGSEYMVKILHGNDTKWINIKNACESIAVGQMDKEGFEEMIKMDSSAGEYIWNRCPFTNDALDMLCRYSGRNALYGKHIANKIIQKINAGRFNGRSYIYPSDITMAICELLRIQDRNLSLSENRATYQLIDDMIKNLEDEKKYLKYLANEMQSKENCYGVVKQSLEEYFGLSNEESIRIALKICSLRGIIQKNEEDVEFYSFTTMFYYNAFVHLINDEGMERSEKVDIDEDGNEAALEAYELPESSLELKKVIMDCYEELDLRDDNDSKNYVKAVKRRIHPVQETIIHTGNLGTVSGDAVQTNVVNSTITVNNMQFNKFDKYFNEVNCEGKGIDVAVSEAQDEYCADIVKELYRKQSKTPGFSLYAKWDDEDIAQITHSNELNIMKLKQKLDNDSYRDYFNQMRMALSLHNEYYSMSEDEKNDADFSPVAILYCKMLEQFLKENYIPLYVEAIPGSTITKNSTTTFAELLDESTKVRCWKFINMGTFSWHLVISNIKTDSAAETVDNCICEDKKDLGMFNYVMENGKYDKMPNIHALVENTGVEESKIKECAEELATIVAIRNDTAHGGTPISKVLFDRFVGILFGSGRERGLLYRIVEIYDSFKAKKNN